MAPDLDAIGTTLQKFFNKKMSKRPPGRPNLCNGLRP